MPESLPYRMRVKSKERLTSAECDDVVVKLDIEPMPGESLQPAVSGQLVRLGLPALRDPSPGYFAIASSPDERRHYELVIKRTSGIGKLLADIEPGALVEVEGPMGSGFDLSVHHGRDIYLVGVGTGIASLCSVWRSIINHRGDFGKVAIYAGFLTPLHRLLTDELDALGEHNIQVNVSLTLGGDDWDGPIGYVQDAIKTDVPDGQNATACLSGMNAMVDACRETLQNLGFDDEYILLNH
ncbi:MAG: hydrogenase [Mariprofundaceae bacterium]